MHMHVTLHLNHHTHTHTHIIRKCTGLPVYFMLITLLNSVLVCFCLFYSGLHASYILTNWGHKLITLSPEKVEQYLLKSVIIIIYFSQWLVLKSGKMYLSKWRKTKISKKISPPVKYLAIYLEFIKVNK